jgi:hypothetical protein
MAVAPSPNQEIEKSEQIAEKVQLILKEIRFTVTKDSIVIEAARTPSELTYKEWRIVKTFIDNIIAEIRAAARTR